MPAPGDAVNVKVALRCRPLSKKELGEGDRSVFKKDNNIAKLHVGNDDVEFGFDHVYDEQSTQLQVYEDVGKPVVDAAFAGFNTTVFAYGQTGSGKSWSMTGSSGENRGLIPRINAEIFERIQHLKSETKLYLVQCSYFEIYNEIVYDLLDPRPHSDQKGGLQIKEHPVLGIHVQGLQQLVVSDMDKIQELMDIGVKNRHVGSTDMNAESSRSHSVCLVTVHQKDTENETRSCSSKVNLVDLAGSERADRTGASGARLKEGANINKSLTTLGSVINALVEQARGKKGVFIQYRNSKLTRVLQESLGGNALCTMLATLSPALANAKETLSTLRYAARAKTIKKMVTKNEESGQIDKLNDEVARLKQMLSAKSDVQGDDEALQKAQGLLQLQIREMEFLAEQTWAEKQQVSQKHETEMQRLREMTKAASKKAEGERRKRFQLLREKGDVELSVRELSLPATWADRARKLDGLLQRVHDRRAHVHALRDALCADLGSHEEDANDAVEAARSIQTAADAAKGRLHLLSGELDALRGGAAALLAHADALVDDVAAALHEVKQGDRTKKARVELVLDQCRARRGALRAALAAARAALVCGDGSADLVGAARMLVGSAQRASDGAADQTQALHDAGDALEAAAHRAAASAEGVRAALEAVGRAGTSAPARPPARPVSVSAGDVKTACLGKGDGWSCVADAYAEFDVGSAHVSGVKVAPGVVSDAAIDGHDVQRTVARLTAALDWKALKLTPAKATKLLNRPPVRFVADALQAISTNAVQGWLSGDAPAPLDLKAPNDVKQAHFDAWLQVLNAGELVSSETILVGSHVEGTNALLQFAAMKAAPGETTATTPTLLNIRALRDGVWTETEVQVHHGKALINEVAERWRVYVLKWAAGDHGACKLGLETGSSLDNAAAGAGDAAATLNEDADALAKCMNTVAGLVADAARAAAGAARRGRSQQVAAEARRLADLEVEVARLRAAEARHLTMQSEGVEREKLLGAEAVETAARLRDHEAQCRKLETEAKLANAKHDETARRLEGATASLNTAEAKVGEVTSELNEARSAVATAEASLKDLRDQITASADKVRAAERREAELLQNIRRAEDAARAAQAEVAERDARLASLREAAKSSEVQSGEIGELKAALLHARETQTAARDADAQRLAQMDGVADELRKELDAARREVATLQESLKQAGAAFHSLRTARAAALSDVQRLTQDRDAAQHELQSMREALITAEAARDAALSASKQADLEVQKLRGAYEAAEARAADASRRLEEARHQTEANEGEARRARVDAAAAEDLVKEAEHRAAQSDLEAAAARDAEGQCRSELEALRSRAGEGDAELMKRNDECAALAQELDDARAEGEAAADVAEQTRLALNVAEEERDTARQAEERLTYEVERIVEERDDGMEGYVRMTDQLNDARDELSDAREQVEAYKEREASGMRGVLNERQDVEARVAEERRKMSEEHAGLVTGLEKLKKRLERHLTSINESPMKRPKDPVDAVAALLDAALDAHAELIKEHAQTTPRDMDFDDAAMDAFDAALKRAAEPHRPSPADTSTQPLENEDDSDDYGGDDFE